MAFSESLWQQAVQLEHAQQLLVQVAENLGSYRGQDWAHEISASRRSVQAAQLSINADIQVQIEDDQCIHEWLMQSLADAKASSLVNSALVECIERLLPDAVWIKRHAALNEDVHFVDRHRHALVIGKGSRIQCDAITLGLMVMAPGVRYPFHNHPPREFYLVLSEGEWYQEGCGWFRPGPGGVVYNPQSIVHTVQSGARPLLALWGLMHT
ncbi:MULTISPECIES: dimethylsulfonioproprionate lyase family protein [unclassified Pseudomonas]|jgi:quercetin dioxygenase-like cupin family protein|uniref:dimethylsulfonioproprionate lyase family protein n=1 Tax=unclassified Pseudomonas TaxID=196821 RepID=UPI000685C416|nr:MULTISPECIES: dimethylsulfonioproprionate lyase family protein [unclassified Pseudomonas]SME97355.1 Dimethlysulfonioproprionate lyase [Pseudomonas sp. LAMO17WK12:I1]